MLFGMELVNWFRERFLHPNLFRGWVRCEIQCSPHHICMNSATYFLSHSPFIYLGLLAQNNPFKASISYGVDSITVVCFDAYAPIAILFAIFVAKIWLRSIHHFFPKLSKLVLGLHSWILTLKCNLQTKEG